MATRAPRALLQVRMVQKRAVPIDFRRYLAGDSPSTFRKDVVNALGLLNPSPRATSVTGTPLASWLNASSKQICWRHATNVIPVWDRN